MNTDKIYAGLIANEYSVKTSRKIIALKKLDAFVKRPARILSYLFGIIAVCVCFAGIGLICSASVIPTVIGFILGIAGIIYAAVNPAVYGKIFEKRKQKYAYDVICLAEEICGD